VASYSFYIKDTADWGWTVDELPAAEAAESLGTKAIQYGCLGMAIGPGNLVIEAWLESFFKEDSLTLSHDLNIRPALGFEREAELERVLRVNTQSHIIKASDADIQWLYGLQEGADLDAIAAEWSKGKLVVITKGPAGVSLYRDGNRTDVAGQKINLVDTVGAGDTFMANFLGELSSLDALGDKPASRLSRLSDDELAAAANVANVAAAIVCERTGCQPPTRAETEARMKRN
jgi:fructokinase